jgi:hypothetical protein
MSHFVEGMVMSNIIAGRFQTQSDVVFAIAELERIGFPRAAISSFYVNPAGQHDLYFDDGGVLGGNSTEERHHPEPHSENWDVKRKAGMMVAVAADTPQQEADALSLLKTIHAGAIECSVGTIIDGDWRDFDPLSTAHLQH